MLRRVAPMPSIIRTRIVDIGRMEKKVNGLHRNAHYLNIQQQMSVIHHLHMYTEINIEPI